MSTLMFCFLQRDVSVSLVVNVCCLKLSYVRLSMQYMSVLPYVFVSLCCSCVCLFVNSRTLKLSYVRLSMQYMSVLSYVFVSLCCSCVCLFVNSRTFLMLHRQPTRDSMLL